MSVAMDWEEDMKRRAESAREIATALFRQRERQEKQRQADEEKRRMDSIFYAGLWIAMAGTLMLFLGSLLWG